MRKLTFVLLVTILLIGCKKNTPPEALFSINPVAGTTDSVFSFDAGASRDAETPADRLNFRWDWESDGQWDTEFTILNAAKHTYKSPGLFLVKLEVMDEDGLKTPGIRKTHKLVVT